MKKEKLVTINVWDSTKKALDKLKVHEQQSYDNLLRMLIKEHKEIDKE